MKSEQESPEKVKKFLKHVIRAAHNQEEKKKAQDELKKQINKVKNVSIGKQKQDVIEKELKKLDEKLNAVLAKEGTLLISGERDSKITDYLKKEIDKVESEVKNLQEKDVKLIGGLKGHIDQLEYELEISKYNHNQESSVNKLEIENIGNAIADLRGRISSFIESRLEREKKMEELEKKIKEKVGKNYNEILKLEKQLSLMEDKYNSINKEGKYDKSIIQEIGDKIQLLREKIVMKKAGIDNQTVPKLKIQEKKKKPLFKKKQVPVRRRLFVKHDMQIKPVEESSKKTENMPDLSSFPESNKKPINYIPEPPKKEVFQIHENSNKGLPPLPLPPKPPKKFDFLGIFKKR